MKCYRALDKLFPFVATFIIDVQSREDKKTAAMKRIYMRYSKIVADATRVCTVRGRVK